MPQQYNPDYDTEHKPEGPSPRSKLMNKIAYAALAIVAIAVGIFIYWAVQPADVAVVNNSPFPVRQVPQTVDKPGVIYVKIDVCKRYSKKGDLRVSYVSSSREIFLPLNDEGLKKGCSNTEYPIPIPKDIVPDTYRLKFRATYDVNPIKQDVQQEFMTQPFKIDPTQNPPVQPAKS